MRNKVIRSIVVAASSVAMMAGLGVASNAAAGEYRDNGVRIRQTAFTSGTVNGLGYVWQPSTLYCGVTMGSSVNGSAIWYRHKNNSTGKSGYSHSSGYKWKSGSFSLQPGTTC